MNNETSLPLEFHRTLQLNMKSGGVYNSEFKDICLTRWRTLLCITSWFKLICEIVMDVMKVWWRALHSIAKYFRLTRFQTSCIAVESHQLSCSESSFYQALPSQLCRFYSNVKDDWSNYLCVVQMLSSPISQHEDIPHKQWMFWRLIKILHLFSIAK